MSLSHNMGLLLKQLSKGGTLTLLIVAAIAGLNAYYLSRHDDLTGAEVAVAVLGIVAAIAFIKTGFIFTFYRILYGSAFEGSFLVIAPMVTFLLLIALGAASALAIPRGEGFPVTELPYLLAVVYVIVSAFLFAVFRISHWVFGRAKR